MSIAAQIAKSLGSAADKIISVFGRWGSAKPADDSKSGIKMGDKVYQVVTSLNSPTLASYMLFTLSLPSFT